MQALQTVDVSCRESKGFSARVVSRFDLKCHFAIEGKTRVKYTDRCFLFFFRCWDLRSTSKNGKRKSVNKKVIKKTCVWKEKRKKKTSSERQIVSSFFFFFFQKPKFKWPADKTFQPCLQCVACCFVYILGIRAPDLHSLKPGWKICQKRWDCLTNFFPVCPSASGWNIVAPFFCGILNREIMGRMTHFSFTWSLSARQSNRGPRRNYLF